jgi:hypothetical protein
MLWIRFDYDVIDVDQPETTTRPCRGPPPSSTTDQRATENASPSDGRYALPTSVPEMYLDSDLDVDIHLQPLHKLSPTWGRFSPDGATERLSSGSSPLVLLGLRYFSYSQFSRKGGRGEGHLLSCQWAVRST